MKKFYIAHKIVGVVETVVEAEDEEHALELCYESNLDDWEMVEWEFDEDYCYHIEECDD